MTLRPILFQKPSPARWFLHGLRVSLLTCTACTVIFPQWFEGEANAYLREDGRLPDLETENEPLFT